MCRRGGKEGEMKLDMCDLLLYKMAARVRYDAWQEGRNMRASTTLFFPGNMRIFLITTEKVRVLFPLRFPPPFFSR